MTQGSQLSLKMMSQQQLLAPISVGVMADYDLKYILFKLSIQIYKKEKKEKRHRDIKQGSCHELDLN